MKPFDEMTSDELFELAKSRQIQEAEKEKEEVKAKLDELRDQRRNMILQHRKELAVVDAEIRKLGGKTRGRSQGRSSGVSITDKVMEIVSNAQEISTKDIKNQLADQGVEANNLSQTLAYLKRQGKVASPGRSMYTLA